MRSNIAVFFGGVSCEHDISVITGLQALGSLGSGYNVFPVYIHSDGSWYTGKGLKNLSVYKDFDSVKDKLQRCAVLPYSNELYFHKKSKLIPLCRLDCAVIAMHGLNGEDGSIAGLMQLANIPYTCPSVLGSSLGMDKISMKIFFEGLGLKVLPYTYINRREYMYESLGTVLKIEDAVGYPLIIKPSMLGSSIGINICKDRAQLIEALEIAIRFDRRVLAERAEENFTEINCSAMKYNNVIRTTECERPVNWKDFLSFEDKYVNGQKGMSGIKKVFPADIEKDKSDKIKEITKKVYSALSLKGVIRADFIVSDDIYINEINTVPGSLSYYLWDYEGITFEKLLDILIREAQEDMRDFNKCTFSFKSNVLACGTGKAAK